MFKVLKNLDDRSTKMMIAILVVIAMAVVAAYVFSRNREMFEDADKPKVEYYYMNGCPWCDKFMPEWEKFEALAAASGVEAAKVEASEAPDKVDQYGIKGFPSVIVTRNGSSAEYKGERTADALMQSVKSS